MWCHTSPLSGGIGAVMNMGTTFRVLIAGLKKKSRPVILACMQTITKLWLVLSAKQRRDPCSGPPTDSTNYRKCVSNFPSTWSAITTNKTKALLTGQSWRVLKSGYTAGSPEQWFRRCFADGVNQSLISCARRLINPGQVDFLAGQVTFKAHLPIVQGSRWVILQLNT